MKPEINLNSSSGQLCPMVPYKLQAEIISGMFCATQFEKQDWNTAP
jgi:hypothetical protein